MVFHQKKILYPAQCLSSRIASIVVLKMIGDFFFCWLGGFNETFADKQMTQFSSKHTSRTLEKLHQSREYFREPTKVIWGFSSLYFVRVFADISHFFGTLLRYLNKSTRWQREENKKEGETRNVIVQFFLMSF